MPKFLCPSCQTTTSSLKYHRCLFDDPHGVIAAAWLGDAQHHLDVRRYFLAHGLSSSHSHALYQAYTSAEAQAACYHFLHPASRYHSVRVSSTLFEANYLSLRPLYHALYLTDAPTHIRSSLPGVYFL